MGFPEKINGRWVEGYVIDNHIVSSQYVGDSPNGHPMYDTVRTELGELLYKMKYNGHNNTVCQIVDIIAPFVKEWLRDKSICCVIPVPASLDRDFQPVYEIAKEIAKRIQTPYCCALRKTSDQQAKNMSKDSKDLGGTIELRGNATREISVLLVDDLYESGSTANECTRILYEDPNIKEVYFLAMTKTR